MPRINFQSNSSHDFIKLMEEINGKSRSQQMLEIINLISWFEKYDEDAPQSTIFEGRILNNRAALKEEIGHETLLRIMDLEDKISEIEPEFDRIRRALINNSSSEASIFICHASEDKDNVARPIAEKLVDLKMKVWFDEFSLKIGDSLRTSIEGGLSRCDYGVVILSHNFFRKNWTNFELDGLTSKEMISNTKKKIILPIRHDMSAEDVIKVSPALGGKISISMDKGIDHVVNEILRAMCE